MAAVDGYAKVAKARVLNFLPSFHAFEAPHWLSVTTLSKRPSEMDACEVLWQARADTAMTSQKENATALQLAAQHGNLDVAKSRGEVAGAFVPKVVAMLSLPFLCSIIFPTTSDFTFCWGSEP